MMLEWSESRRREFVFILIVSAVIFALDMYSSASSAVPVAYVSIVLIALGSKNQAITLSSAILSTLLIVLGFYLSPLNGEGVHVISNRILAMYVVWIVAVVSLLGIANTQAVMAQVSKQQLTAFRETLGQVAEYASDAIVITDANGFVTWVNKGFTQISGYSLDEVMGKKPGDVLQGKETDVNAVRLLSQAIAKAEPIDIEIINYHKNGTPYWIDMSINPVFEHNQLRRFVAVERDITHRKQLETYIAERAQTASQQTHIQAQFADLIALDLAVIQQGLACLQHTHPNAEGDAFIQHMGQLMAAATGYVQVLSRFEQGELKPKMQRIDVVDWLNERTASFAALLKAQGGYWHVDCQLSSFASFQGAVLLLNAVIQYCLFKSARYGSVELLVTQTTSQSEAWIELTFVFNDHGEFYQQTKSLMHDLANINTQDSVNHACGYLSILKIVEAFEGSLTTTLAAGERRTQSVLKIPALAFEAPPAAPKSELKDRVLIAEDNRVNAMVLTKMLQSLGYAHIDVAVNGEEAVQKFHENQYAVIFMDNHMPVMTGIEATKQIKMMQTKTSPGADVPIIACTADISSQATQDFYDSGVSHVLFKPVDKAKLAQALAAVQAHTKVEQPLTLV